MPFIACSTNLFYPPLQTCPIRSNSSHAVRGGVVTSRSVEASTNCVDTGGSRWWRFCNDCESPVDDVTLLDMRTVGGSDADNYVLGAIDRTYLAKMIYKSYLQFPTYIRVRFLKHFWNPKFSELTPSHLFITPHRILSVWVFKRGHAVAQVVDALRYKPEGRGFGSLWCHWNFSLK
jgi:hypothetical protein